jgi:hypothetical protein
LLPLHYRLILWSSSYGAKYEEGRASVFWNSAHGFFRIVTTWNSQNGPRQTPHDINIVGTELVTDYAYEDNYVLYFSRTNLRSVDQTRRDSNLDTSESGDRSKVGFIYKFRSFPDMLKFQGAFTRETVYQDLIKRVSTVKIKKKGERGGHTMGYVFSLPHYLYRSPESLSFRKFNYILNLHMADLMSLGSHEYNYGTNKRPLHQNSAIRPH